MLVDFQQALADLTASPPLCLQVRADAQVLHQHYRLTEREFARLVGIVKHEGMACACTVYRANRLAPLAMNIPLTCKALGAHLRRVASDYWAAYPEGNVHFYVETHRFCNYLQARLASGEDLPPDLAPVLRHEAAAVAAALAESRTEAGLPRLN